MKKVSARKTRNHLDQNRREQLFGMIDEVWKRNKRVPLKVIEREVAAAVKAIRAKTSRRKV